MSRAENGPGLRSIWREDTNPGERRHTDRRRRSQTELLPPPRTPEEYRSRQRMRLAGGLFLVLFSGFCIGATLALMATMGNPQGIISLSLAVVMLVQGVMLVVWQDRRRYQRRRRLQTSDELTAEPRERQRPSAGHQLSGT